MGVPLDRSGRTRAARVVVSSDRWPLLTMHWPPGERSDEDVRAACDSLRKVVARDEPHVFLVDGRRATLPTPWQLREIVRLSAELESRSRCAATAMVVASPSIKALFDSIRWMKVSRQRFASFRSVHEAERWLRGFLDFP
ncbi:MAG TPA: hypothetical protein RMH99_01285 [Sandaracinaceae bacterium LLY-WYZ-13_1]|nr:hypothetical protein [Sandaracinaceae bacterium LLY-WYZ-13_1]